MIQGVLVKTTLVDYPGKVAAAYFMSGCNLYCPYCYNVELVENTLPKEDSISPLQVLEHLKKRKNILSGIVLSGGEPLIHSELPYLIAEIKKIGMKVKLDTNGMLPEKLEKLFDSKETSPDFVALDVKTSPKRYFELTKNQIFSKDYEKNILQSIEFLSTLPADHREFRTVFVPPLIGKNDIATLANILPSDASWMFANFRAENCLNKEYNKLTPYTSKEIDQLIEQAKKIIPGTQLR